MTSENNTTPYQFNEIINTIVSFPFSTDFIDWVSNGDFSFSILSEAKNNRTYTRSVRITVKNMVVISGLMRILKNSIDEHILNDFIKTRKSIGRYIALNPDSQLTKQIVNTTTTGRDYHIVSHICYNSYTCGHCSELFNIPNIALLFQEKQQSAKLTNN